MRPFRVAKPQTEAQKRTDLASWKTFGTALDRRRGLLCQTFTPEGDYACRAYGSYYHNGLRYCGHHAPAGAERR